MPAPPPILEKQMHLHHKEYTSLHAAVQPVLTRREKLPYDTQNAHNAYTWLQRPSPSRRYEMLSSSIVLDSSMSTASPLAAPFAFCSAA